MELRPSFHGTSGTKMNTQSVQCKARAGGAYLLTSSARTYGARGSELAGDVRRRSQPKLPPRPMPVHSVLPEALGLGRTPPPRRSGPLCEGKREAGHGGRHPLPGPTKDFFPPFLFLLFSSNSFI